MRQVPDVDEQLVVGIDVLDVVPALADRRPIEEPGQEQGHLAAGHRPVRREGPPGRSLGYPQDRQLLDGVPGGGGQAPDVLESLIRGPRKQDPGRTRRPSQEEGHLPAGHLTVGFVVPVEVPWVML